MEEFKLQFYYNLYKEFPVVNRDNFRKLFEYRHGRFKYFNELVLMIEKHQHKMFGESLYNDTRFMPSRKGRKR